MSFKIFINYRRSDSEAYAGRLHDHLAQIYSHDRLFIDVDSIGKGEDFVLAMKEKVAQSDVFLAVIGPTWLNVKDNAGVKRLSDPEDPVRVEIEKAIATGKIIIPVRIGKTEMPREKQLPATLRALARLNAESLAHEGFAGDVKRIAREIERAVKRVEENRQAVRLQAEEDARKTADKDVWRHAAEVRRRRESEGALKHEAGRTNAQVDQKTEVSVLKELTAQPPDILASVAKAEELANWDFVKSRSRISELREHLKRWPNGVTHHMALTILEPLEWRALGPRPSLDDLCAFTAAFPRGEHREEADVRITVERVKKHIAEAESSGLKAKTPEERVNAITALAKTIEIIGAENFENPSAWTGLLEKKAWQIVERSADINSLRGFYKGFPASARRSKVQKRILRLERRGARPTLRQKLGIFSGGIFQRDKVAPSPTATNQFSISRRRITLGASALAVVSGGYGIWKTLKEPGSSLRIVNADLLLKGHTSAVTNGLFSPGGTRVLTSSWDGTARIWSISSGKDPVVLRKHGGNVNSAVFSALGTRVLTSSDDKTARVWDTRTGEELAVMVGHNESLDSAAFSPDANWVVTASADSTVRVWSTRTGAQDRVFTGHGAWVHSAVFSPNGLYVLTASNDHTARLWNISDPSRNMVLRGHQDWVSHAEFSPDGKSVLTCSYDMTARIWDTKTGAVTNVLSGHSARIMTAKFSPDGKMALTASYDKSARLWDTNTGYSAKVLVGHEKRINAASFSPDGKTLVTASADFTARLWDVSSATQLAILRGHEGDVNSAAFSPDGRQVATTSYDRMVRLWNV